ncbi:hypothetical protein [Halogeometricum sp. CBA1124]|uniref:hypothetical protein n=1 Tax=Halogeometricum sp. CBA1124 TaxID=2668071 RepID=UPI001E4A77D6|nr:hypothetical protein [Halogeometricum sp. CBA1124]
MSERERERERESPKQALFDSIESERERLKTVARDIWERPEVACGRPSRANASSRSCARRGSKSRRAWAASRRRSSPATATRTPSSARWASSTPSRG